MPDRGRPHVNRSSSWRKGGATAPGGLHATRRSIAGSAARIRFLTCITRVIQIHRAIRVSARWRPCTFSMSTRRFTR